MPPERDLRDRLPPQSPEAEKSVLGSMLRDNGCIGDIVNVIRPDSFYADAHQKICQAIYDLYDKGHPVDLVVLAETLNQRGQLDDIGRHAYLASLWDAAPTAANSEYYARIVRDRSIVRNLIHVSTELLRDAYDQAEPADELLASAERRILAVAEGGLVGQTVRLEVALQEAYDRLDRRHEGQTELMSGLATGFLDLDEITAGLQNSELIIVAARPSVGKCLAHDAELVLDDGSVVTIEEIYQRRRAKLLTLKDDWKLDWTEPSAFVDDGIKPVYRVTTRLGRQVETTLCHPFRTLEGWKPLAELKVGAGIAVPRKIPVFGTLTLSDVELETLARVICIADNELVGDSLITNSQHYSSDPAKQTIPSPVFQLAREQLASYLREVFKRRGWLQSADGVSVLFWSRSERVARQLQHLLLRFGIVASLLKSKTGFNTQINPVAWFLIVNDPSSLRAFFAEIGAFPAPSDPGLASEEMIEQGDVHWDTIVSIEPLGHKQVYDLTIEGTHNFVANDICVHNTAFALNLIRNIVLQSKAAVFFVSLEQSRIELAERLLCSQARVDSHKLRKGHLSGEDLKQLIDAGGELGKAKLFIDDSPGQGMLRIAANARRLKLRENLKLVVIDYLQLIEPDDRRAPRQEQVAQISRRLKFLARELTIPVIALAQVNRSSEDRQDHRPRLADLRESGSIEQDADTVMMLHRPDRFEPGQHEGLVEVLIAKQRNGPTGEVNLTYVKQYMRFENFEKEAPFSS